MVSTIGNALSGYAAASARLETSANNIANAFSTTTVTRNNEKREEPVAPERVVQTPRAEGGVEFRRERENLSDEQRTASQSVIDRPNVDLNRQTVNAIIASYDAKANLRVLEAENKTLKQVLNIIA